MHQLALYIGDEARAQDDLRDAPEAAAAPPSVASVDLGTPLGQETSLPLAAIVVSAYACLRWLSADPPNIERARLAAERTIRDANAAEAIAGRLRRGGRLRTPSELKGDE